MDRLTGNRGGFSRAALCGCPAVRRWAVPASLRSASKTLGEQSAAFGALLNIKRMIVLIQNIALGMKYRTHGISDIFRPVLHAKEELVA